MEKTGKAIIHLFFFYIVAIAFNTFEFIDLNAPIIIDIAKAIGICFAISIFLRIIRISWDSAFFTGLIFVYISSVGIMYIDSESPMVLINFIIAIVLSIIVTKN